MIAFSKKCDNNVLVDVILSSTVLLLFSLIYPSLQPLHLPSPIWAAAAAAAHSTLIVFHIIIELSLWKFNAQYCSRREIYTMYIWALCDNDFLNPVQTKGSKLRVKMGICVFGLRVKTGCAFLSVYLVFTTNVRLYVSLPYINPAVLRGKRL